MPTKKKNPLTTDTIDFAKLYTPTSKQMEAHLRPEKYILFGGAMRGGKSVHKDTIVLSKTKGYIPICEVEKNDFILSMTEKGKLEYSKVLNTNYIPNELTYKITTRTEQSIICSYTHPVLTQRGWVRYNELILDDKYILIGRGIYAVKDWGYSEGTVADVITGILKGAEKPLNRDQIYQQVLEQRQVNKSTIYLTLINKDKFNKTQEGLFSLK